MWLLSLPVHLAELPASLFGPTQILAAGLSTGDLWIILRLVSIGLLILRLLSRIFSGSSSQPAPVRSAPATSWFSWGRLLAIAFAIGCLVVAQIYLPKHPKTSFASDQMRSVQSVVTSYMYARTSSPSYLQFLDWSDLENNGSDWLVTVHYKAMQRSGEWTTATVRFTVHGGTVTNARVLGQS